MGTKMSLADLVIDSIKWSEVGVLRGSGEDLANSLRRFVRVGSTEEAASLWEELEGVAFSQNTIYGGAVPVVDVMLAVLADRPADFLRPWVVELLRFIITGDSVSDPSLRNECIYRAGAGRWLLAAEACRTGLVDYRDALIEVLDVIDQALGQIVAAATEDGNESPWLQ
jgi:hypothetical protein